MRLTIPRLFDAARVLATDIGPKISEFVEFTQQAVEQVLRALRNNLTFTDNFRCEVMNVVLYHNTEVPVNNGIAVGGIIPIKAYSDVGAEAIDSYQIRLDAVGKVYLKFKFVSADSTRKVTTRVILLGE